MSDQEIEGLIRRIRKALNSENTSLKSLFRGALSDSLQVIEDEVGVSMNKEEKHVTYDGKNMDYNKLKTAVESLINLVSNSKRPSFERLYGLIKLKISYAEDALRAMPLGASTKRTLIQNFNLIFESQDEFYDQDLLVEGLENFMEEIEDVERNR